MDNITMEPSAVIQILIGLLVTIVMAIAQAARSEGQRDRTEILERLAEIGTRQADLETRLAILEHDFADIDPHPSQHRKPK